MILEKVRFYITKEEGTPHAVVEVDAGQFEILWKNASDWNEFYDLLGKLHAKWNEEVKE